MGLERIELLLEALGRPQRQFASAHVVGTNGKSSVTAMTAALLQAHGRRAGAYLSPHRGRWAERVRIEGAVVEPPAFGRAAERVAAAVAEIERELDPRNRVTQFEAATATAFLALADGGVEIAVIEAGLGGRLDATNVLPSAVTALTSVGLDHTQWLGESEREIAQEKLAVLREGSVLVAGELSDEIARIARAHAAARRARYVAAVADGAAASYPQRNAAVARAVARELIGPLDPAASEAALGELVLPGRLELREGPPPMVLDAAHNPPGARALAEALPAVTGGRPAVGCVAVLDDKDADGIAAALAPALRRVVCTELPAGALQGIGRPGARSLGASELVTRFAAHGMPAEALPDPSAALARARALARGSDGIVVVCGSHYLLDWA